MDIGVVSQFNLRAVIIVKLKHCRYLQAIRTL